jgi:transcription termination/antitermination protein NusA
MNAKDLIQTLDQMCRDKGIDKQKVIRAIEDGIASAAKRKCPGENIEAYLNPDSGEIELYSLKTVAETVEDPAIEISYDEARNLLGDVDLGEEIEIRKDIGDIEELGRIAAQTTRQVILQRIRDAERDTVYDHFKDKLHELVNGAVARFEKGNVYVEMGKTEAILPRSEQAPRDNYKKGDRIRALLLEVRRGSTGPQVVLSRTHPALLVELFALEVPEIYDGVVEIVGAVREPGVRAKVAVRSNDRNVDPVGACVGTKGSRVQAIVRELRGENIDIIQYSDDIVHYVSNALSPAQVREVILNREAKQMVVVVPDEQLSLAIGNRGINVRLAVKLTGWNIDIRPESDSTRERSRLSEARAPQTGEAEAPQTGEAETPQTGEAETATNETQGSETLTAQAAAQQDAEALGHPDARHAEGSSEGGDAGAEESIPT